MRRTDAGDPIKLLLVAGWNGATAAASNEFMRVYGDKQWGRCLSGIWQRTTLTITTLYHVYFREASYKELKYSL